MPLVVLRVTEYDVVWTVPTPVMHVAPVEPPSSLAGGLRRQGDSGVGRPAEGQRGPRSGGTSGGSGNGRVWQSGSAGVEIHDGQELEWWRIGCWSVQ